MTEELVKRLEIVSRSGRLTLGEADTVKMAVAALRCSAVTAHDAADTVDKARAWDAVIAAREDERKRNEPQAASRDQIDDILRDHFYTGEPGDLDAIRLAAKALRAIPQTTPAAKDVIEDHEFKTLVIAEAHERYPQANGHSRPAFIAGAKWAREHSRCQAVSERDDLGIVLSALRMLEEATGEKFDDEEGVIAEIERDHAALTRPLRAEGGE